MKSETVNNIFDDNSTSISNGLTGLGTFTTLLEDYATGNSTRVFNYGTKTMSAEALRAASTASQLRIANFAKFGGNTIGIIGIGIGTYQYKSNQISGLEYGVDSVIGAAAIVTSIFAAPAVATVFGVGAVLYFGGKMIYELNSGNTMYTKPNLKL